MDFTAAFLARGVRLDLLTLRGPIQSLHRIGPPSVRVAAAVQELAPAAADARHEQHADAWHALRVALSDWLPLSLLSLLFSRRVAGTDDEPFAPGRANVVAVVGGLLMVGFPSTLAGTPTEEAEAEKALKRKAGSEGWAAVIAEHRAVYGGTTQALLEEPYAHFVAQHRLIDEVRAKAELSQYRSAVLSAPYADEATAQRALDATLERSGLDPESVKAFRELKALEEQPRQLARMMATYEAVRSGGGLA